MDAVNEALAAANGTAPVQEEAAEPAQSAAAVVEERSAKAQGFGGEVAVKIGLDAEGKIAAIEIGDESFNETRALGGKAQEPEFYEQFIGQTGPFTLGENIDAITGATMTSQAVVDAVNEALAPKN